MTTSGTVAQTNMKLNLNGYSLTKDSCYVYIDRLDSGAAFYVGIGNAKRVRASRRSKFHTSVSSKSAWWSRTIIENAPFDACKDFEKLLISELGRRDNRTGILVNHTDGGDGVLGRVISKEERANNPAKKSENRIKSSLRMTVANPMKRKEVAQKVSLALSGCAHPPEVVLKRRLANTGKKRTTEFCLAMSIRQKGQKRPSICGSRNPMANPVYVEKMATAQRGKPKSEAHKAALRDSHVGHKWIVNISSGKSTTVPAEKADNLVSSGEYIYGRKL